MKLKFFMYFVLLSITIITLSCATALTKGGQSVRLLMKQEAPTECTLLGDVKTRMGEVDVISVKNYLRNKSAELGGNCVVVDTIEVVNMYNNGVMTTYYQGTGRAYKCPSIPEIITFQIHKKL